MSSSKKVSWPIRSTADIESTLQNLSADGRLILENGLNWTLQANSAANGVLKPQFDLSIKLLVDGQWISAVVRHHRSVVNTATASGKSGIQLARGFSQFSANAQQLWVNALANNRKRKTPEPPQQTLEVTNGFDLDLNLPASDSEPASPEPLDLNLTDL
jgi:hypothetical protein